MHSPAHIGLTGYTIRTDLAMQLQSNVSRSEHVQNHHRAIVSCSHPASTGLTYKPFTTHLLMKLRSKFRMSTSAQLEDCAQKADESSVIFFEYLTTNSFDSGMMSDRARTMLLASLLESKESQTAPHVPTCKCGPSLCRQVDKSYFQSTACKLRRPARSASGMDAHATHNSYMQQCR